MAPEKREHLLVRIIPLPLDGVKPYFQASTVPPLSNDIKTGPIPPVAINSTYWFFANGAVDAAVVPRTLLLIFNPGETLLIAHEVPLALLIS